MNNFTVASIAFGLGVLFTVITFNLVAQDAYTENPSITLSEYWTGK